MLTRAGSADVIEVHGSIRTASCPACGERMALADLVEALGDDPAPRCARCGEILKPDVVMFGELLPVGALERAQQLVRTAGMLLVVGSSLEVYPVAALPDEALAAGASLAIVNQAPTPYDGLAEVRVDGPAGATLAALAEALASP